MAEFDDVDLGEPITWQVLQVLQVLVKRATRANGYRTDLGAGEISLDRSQLFLNGAAKTLIVADDLTVDSAKSSKNIINSDIGITLEFAVPFNPLDETIKPELLAHRGAADLRRVLAVDLRGTPLNFRRLDIGATTFSAGVDDGASAFVLAQVTARAGLTELFSPAT